MLFNLANMIFAVKEAGKFHCADNFISVIKRVSTSDFFELDISPRCQFPFKILRSDSIPRGQQQGIIFFKIQKQLSDIFSFRAVHAKTEIPIVSDVVIDNLTISIDQNHIRAFSFDQF